MARKVYVREIYFYIVCLITLIIFIIGLIYTYSGIVDYIKPSTYFYGLTERQAQIESGTITDMEQLEELIEKDREQFIENEKTNSLKSLFRGILLIVIVVPIFTYHWIKAKQLWHTE